MNVQQTGIPYQIYGNEVIGFTKAKDLKKLVPGHIDLTSMQEYYERDPNRAHLGLQKSWQQQESTYKPIYYDLLEKKNVIEVDGFEGEFTYDVPVYTESRVETVGDTSDQPYPGVDDSVFKIILSDMFTKGDVLTADPWYNEFQIVVDSDEEVKQVGTGYLHYVKLTNHAKDKAYPAWLLKPGVKYTKINHVGNEFTTTFSKVNLPGKANDIITARFQLGGIRGVEGWVSGFADKKSVVGLGANSIMDLIEYESEMKGGADAVLFSDFSGNPQKPFTTRNLRAGTLMEYLVHRELDKLTNKSLIWQKGGVVRNDNRNIILNEGLIHQARRGFRLTYNRPGGITTAHIANLADYVFKANPNLPVEKRYLHLKAGKGAYDNVTALFQDLALKQLSRISGFGLMGTDRQLPKSPVTGELDSLVLGAVMFKGIFIPNIGNVTIEHDPNLDYEPLTDEQMTGAHQNGLSRSSYSIVIWDVTQSKYSNNQEGLKRSNFSGKMMEGGNSNANIFLVKPEGHVNYWGRNNGRWDMGAQMIQQGSVKFIGQEFFAYNSSATWIKDPSRVAMLELSPRAQVGGSYFSTF